MDKLITTKAANGDIVLGYGQHEINILMDKTPCHVFLKISEPCDSTPVCHGDVNKISFTIFDNGFTLYANIRTNSCCIEWTCNI